MSAARRRRHRLMWTIVMAELGGAGQHAGAVAFVHQSASRGPACGQADAVNALFAHPLSTASARSRRRALDGQSSRRPHLLHVGRHGACPTSIGPCAPRQSSEQATTTRTQTGVKDESERKPGCRSISWPSSGPSAAPLCARRGRILRGTKTVGTSLRETTEQLRQCGGDVRGQVQTCH